MQSTWTPPLRWVFAAATLFGIFSTLQAYRLTTLSLNTPMDIQVGKMLLLNLVYWYIPALADAGDLPARAHGFGSMARTGFARCASTHVRAVSYSVIHCACMMGMRVSSWALAARRRLWPGRLYVQQLYLENLDFTLMTYTTVRRDSVTRCNLQPRVAGARRQGSAARNAAGRSAAAHAASRAPAAFSFQHATRNLLTCAYQSRWRRSNDQPTERSVATDVRSLGCTTNFAARGARVPAEVSRDRADPFQRSALGALRDRSGNARCRSPAAHPAAARGECHQARISPKPGAGLVQISTKRLGNDLWIEVSDNGVGLSAGARAQLRSGVGLSNTRDRLECLYGDGAAHRVLRRHARAWR